MTEFYNLVERSAQWPTAMHEIPFAALRKDTGTSPLDVRPISLAPILYRIWAKIRFTPLHCWHAFWLFGSLKPYVEVRRDAKQLTSTTNSPWTSSNQASKHPLFGIFWDYKKCFDNVAWTIVYGLLRKMGMPHVSPCPGGYEAMFSYTCRIQRRFKLGTSVGPLFSNTNDWCWKGHQWSHARMPTCFFEDEQHYFGVGTYSRMHRIHGGLQHWCIHG